MEECEVKLPQLITFMLYYSEEMTGTEPQRHLSTLCQMMSLGHVP